MQSHEFFCMSDSEVCQISVIVSACRRREPLLRILGRSCGCRLAPAEILVHVDSGAAESVTAGLLEGLRMIPRHLKQYKKYRLEVNRPTLLSWLWLKRSPMYLGDARNITSSCSVP